MVECIKNDNDENVLNRNWNHKQESLLRTLTAKLLHSVFPSHTHYGNMLSDIFLGVVFIYMKIYYMGLRSPRIHIFYIDKRKHYMSCARYTKKSVVRVNITNTTKITWVARRRRRRDCD